MTAGTLPFDGKSMEQVHFGILRGQFDVPDHFSRELTDLLRNMFAVDPSIRIDIEKLMESGWVNKGYSQPPAKLTPPKRNKDTLAKAISSIYVDDNGNTIYNVHSHLRLKLQKQIAAFEGKHSNSSLSKLKKKKNIVSQQSSENVKRGYSSDSESTTGNLSASPSESPISIVTPQKMDFKEISNQMSNISVLAEVSREVSESMLPSPLTTQLQVPQFWSPRRSFDKIPSPVEKNRRNRSASCGMADQPSISSTSELQSARELSIVRRMTSVSAHGSANCSSESIVDVGKIEFKEINDWHLIHKPAKEIRTKKLLFRKGLTTALDPPSMFQDLHKALVELRQIFTDLKITRVDDYYGFYVIFNTDYPVQLHIELCNSWFTNSKGLRIKNLQGDADQFVSLLINKLAW
ncbi:Serine/threonine-protein kinase par-1 [Boothiomyces macroporosus]|uniref:Serine/threonine-protein kinase par-1 n=1 Tax=Boothiomyces macroporosus TaxID=261099 RepID=A0AAD5UMF8_9FUNG|nr:Serine/threonine-protein kinase par-1 [Boothiomyces macroporosus]